MKITHFVCLVIFMPYLLNAQWQKINISGNNDLYEVHFKGSTAYLVGQNSALKKSIDSGKSWSNLTLTTPSNLRTVYFISSDTGFVSGENARIQKTVNGGVSWTQKYVRTAAYAYDIQFVGQNGLCVGRDMLALSSFDLGETWQADTTFKSYKKLNSVCITPNSNCWAVGDSGYILKKNITKRNWIKINSPTSINLNFISHFGNAVLFICGGMPDTIQVGNFINIYLLSTDTGKTWTQTSISEMKIINAAWFSNIDTGFFIGSNGIISKSYQPFTRRGLQLSGSASSLNDIQFSNGIGLIVGDGGLVLRTTNGGGFGLNSKSLYQTNIRVIPNPSGGHIQILGTDKISKIELFDIHGKRISFDYDINNQSLKTSAYGLLFLCIYLEDGGNFKTNILID